MTELSIEVDGRTTRIVARDDAGHVVGTAWFELTTTGRPSPAGVFVEPANRGCGVGSELLVALVDAASRRGVTWLTSTGDGDGRVVTHLARASHIPCATRVSGGETKAVVLVPAAA